MAKEKTTKTALIELMVEPVAHNLIDSGMAYGYMHDRNKKNLPHERPEAWVEYRIWNNRKGKKRLDTYVTRNLYHFLYDNLSYDPQLDKQFQKWRRKHSNKELSTKLLKEFSTDEVPEDTNWKWTYTYNRDNNLSQDFIVWYPKNRFVNQFVIIAIHGGCDARCGFTREVMFRPKDEYGFLDVNFADVICSECRAHWSTYGCGFFKADLWDPRDSIKGLEEYPFEAGEEGKKGILVLKDKHTAFCPVCGKGILEVF